MLSQDDRLELERIATRLRTEDPEFARALRDGKPRRPKGDRRWPFLLAMAVAGAAYLAGMLLQSIATLALGAAASTGAALAYWVRVRASQGPRVRRNTLPR